MHNDTEKAIDDLVENMRGMDSKHIKDQENVTKAINMIQDLMRLNQHIDPNQWASAIMGTMVIGYKSCGFSHKEYSEEMKRVIKHYKEWWENDQ